MSLLGTPVYANPSTPLWVGAGGGTVNGNLIVDGFLTAGRVASSKAIEPGFGNFALTDASGNTCGGLNQVGAVGASDVYVNVGSGNKIQFGLVGFSSGNSYITPSAVGANTDLLSVGGQILSAPGGGISPIIPVVGGPVTVTQNATPVALTITPAVTLLNGATYDIQVSGYWAVGAGTTTPATADVASLTLQTGTGSSPGNLRYLITDYQYPALAEAPWTSASFHPFHIRVRAPSNGAVLTLTPAFTGTGTYVSNAVNIVVSDLSVVRVA